MKIAVINPVSSGKCLLNSLEDFGANVIKIYEDHLKPVDGDFFVFFNFDETVEYLKAQGVQSIINGSEFGTFITDKLNSLMGFPGNDFSKVKSRISKYEMVKQLQQSGLRCAQSYIIDSHSQLELLSPKFTFPLFIKPVESAGSDGCKKINNFTELSSFFNGIHGKLNLLGKMNNSLIIQEYIEGEQFIVNSVSLNGKHYISEVYSVRIDQCNGVPIYRSIVTLDISTESEVYHLITDYVKECLTSLGVSEGAAHSELRLTKTGPCLIEVNSRIMGPVLDVDAFYCAFGYSQPSLLCESIIHPEIFSRRLNYKTGNPKKHFSMVFLRCTAKGKISHRKGLENIRRLPGYHSLRNLPGIGYYSLNPLLTTGDFGIAYFCHEDKVLLEHSLSVLHQMEDENIIFGMSPYE